MYIIYYKNIIQYYISLYNILYSTTLYHLQYYIMQHYLVLHYIIKAFLSHRNNLQLNRTPGSLLYFEKNRQEFHHKGFSMRNNGT